MTAMYVIQSHKVWYDLRRLNKVYKVYVIVKKITILNVS